MTLYLMRLYYNAFVLVEVYTAKDVKFILANSVDRQAFLPQMIEDKGAEC
jgi:hypothetical protein